MKMHVSIYDKSMHICTRTYKRSLGTYVCVYIYTSTCVYVHICAQMNSTYMYICIHVRSKHKVCKYACVRVFACACVWVRMCGCFV